MKKRSTVSRDVILGVFVGLGMGLLAFAGILLLARPWGADSPPADTLAPTSASPPVYATSAATQAARDPASSATPQPAGASVMPEPAASATVAGYTAEVTTHTVQPGCSRFPLKEGCSHHLHRKLRHRRLPPRRSRQFQWSGILRSWKETLPPHTLRLSTGGGSRCISLRTPTPPRIRRAPQTWWHLGWTILSGSSMRNWKVSSTSMPRAAFSVRRIKPSGGAASRPRDGTSSCTTAPGIQRINNTSPPTNSLIFSRGTSSVARSPPC